MTTIRDPLGTPTVVYNRSGMAIVDIQAVNAPSAIPQVCGWMVAVVTATEVNPFLTLPTSAQIGDAIEVHLINEAHGKLTVTAPSGESIVRTGEVHFGTGRIFRKVSPTLWAVVGIPSS